MTKYKDQETKRQLKCYYSRFFKEAKNSGHWNFYDDCGNFTKRVHLNYILRPEDSLSNLFQPISWLALDYFKRYDIAWWREDEDRYFPTGHLLSSQIHCLNHLFALRKGDNVDETKQIIKTIIEKATKLKIKEVLQCPLDSDGGYITFEFVYKNRTLLHEKHETRGANCTSIDALVFVETEENKSVLIPIEWKYTESYDKKKKAEADVVNERYKDLASRPYSNLNGWKDEYYYDPLYEFARQTLLME